METMTTTPTPGELVQAKTINLVIRCGRFGNSKKASMAGVTIDADKGLLGMSKQLLDSPELNQIGHVDGIYAAKIRNMAFKSLFKGGIYMLPVAMVTTAEEVLAEWLAVRTPLIDAACAVYQQRIEETSQRLGVVFNPSDYPGTDRFREKFYLEYSYVTFETPSRLRGISAELFRAEADKARRRLESVADECQQAMRAGLAGLVDHLAERLTPGEDGKAKRLSHSTIGNLNDFLAQFELRDVTDDAELGNVVLRARAVMQGLDHKMLKSSDMVRDKVAAELGELKAAIEPLLLDKGTRVITFDDED